jgi:hypothetical protein
MPGKAGGDRTSDFCLYEIEDVGIGRVVEFSVRCLPRLKARLDQLDSELGAPPLFTQWIVALRRTREWSLVSVRWLTVVAASALLIVVVLRMTSVPPVSAREILERTKKAETQRLEKVAGQVVYRKLQIRRGSSAPRAAQVVSWETWNDVAHSRFRQRVEDENGQRFIAGEIDSEHATPPVLMELQQILQANRMDVRHPLSASVYENWRRGLHLKTEEVVEQPLAGWQECPDTHHRSHGAVRDERHQES